MMNNAAPNYVLTVPFSVTMRCIAAFTSDLLDACLTHQHLVLDVDAVTQADLSFVQAVHAAQTHMQANGRALSLARPARDLLASLLISSGLSSDSDHVDFWFHGELPQ